MMERFFIITNRHKDPELAVARRIQALLRAAGRSCALPDAYETSAYGPSALPAPLPDDIDCCIVLGGDGTMLQAAHSLRNPDVPLLGVNLGSLGYLAEIDREHIDEAIGELLRGRFEIERRMMLEGRPDRGDGNFALNDIVIARSGALQVINLNIFVNEKPLTSYQADGVILSTPTGSTSYNMSAGGPIVEPCTEAILLTPICPHSLNARSLVLSPTDVIRVEIGEEKGNKPQSAQLSFDGMNGGSMKNGDTVEVKRSDRPTRLLRLSRLNFLEILQKKLG